MMGGNGVIQDGNGLGAYYLIGHDACNTNLGTPFTNLMASAGHSGSFAVPTMQ